MLTRIISSIKIAIAFMEFALLNAKTKILGRKVHELFCILSYPSNFAFNHFRVFW